MSADNIRILWTARKRSPHFAVLIASTLNSKYSRCLRHWLSALSNEDKLVVFSVLILSELSAQDTLT